MEASVVGFCSSILATYAKLGVWNTWRVSKTWSLIFGASLVLRPLYSANSMRVKCVFPTLSRIGLWNILKCVFPTLSRGGLCDLLSLFEIIREFIRFLKFLRLRVRLNEQNRNFWCDRCHIGVKIVANLWQMSQSDLKFFTCAAKNWVR